MSESGKKTVLVGQWSSRFYAFMIWGGLSITTTADFINRAEAQMENWHPDYNLYTDSSSAEKKKTVHRLLVEKQTVENAVQQWPDFTLCACVRISIIREETLHDSPSLPRNWLIAGKE